MAVKYLYSGATGTASGDDWTNAYTTMTAAIAGMVAGATLYVASDHSESIAGAITLTFPGTISAPNYVICATRAATPPTAVATTASVATTGGNIIIAGVLYVYGVKFISSAALTVGSASNSRITLDSCLLQLNSTSSVFIQIGANSSAIVTWYNTKVQFGASAQAIKIYTTQSFAWYNTPGAVNGTVPAALFSLATVDCKSVVCRGVDLSTLTTSLCALGTSMSNDIYFVNCKLSKAVSGLLTGAVNGPQIRYRFDSCGASDPTTTRAMDWYSYAGVITNSQATYLTSGASDGVIPLAWLMASSASSCKMFALESPQMAVWNTTVGSTVTLSVEVLHDSATSLTNADIWLEVEGYDTASYPLSTFTTNERADLLATPANQATGAGSSSWTISPGMTNPNSQKLSVTITPQEIGFIACRVLLALPSKSVFVNPKVAVS